MAKEFTAREVRMLVTIARKNAGGLRPLARKWGLSYTYVDQVEHGSRSIGPKILSHLGLRREVVPARTRYFRDR